jgi:hypothetical protein
MLAALGACALTCALAPGAGAESAAPAPPGLARTPEVTVALLPSDTSVPDLAGAPRTSIGVLSAGLGDVPAEQTFLDLSQGNRVFDSLYDRELPPVPRFTDRVPNWDRIAGRADSAPADIVPGLLASTLAADGLAACADPSLAGPALIATERGGTVARPDAETCRLRVVPASLADLPALVERLRGDDLLVAIAPPPPPGHGALPVGIAGRGFGGPLTSDSTRTEGYVLSTDLAPTILRRFGLDVPDEMNGEPIRGEGEADVDGVIERAGRMRVIPERRGPVVMLNLLIWMALAGLASLAGGVRIARPALALLGLSFLYLPPVLLGLAGVDPSEVVERLAVGLGAPALAALTLALVPGWWALALPCGLTAGAYGVDVILGSPLTELSLLGPNPGLGARFFGIGNELEAALAVTVPVGVGAVLAALTARGREVSSPFAVVAFLGAGALGAAVFAAGRFGADVGAAIVLPVGTVVAALMVPGVRWRGLPPLAVIVAPVLALASLALLDLVLGGESHLTRAATQAGGGDLGDVAERRLRLSAHGFSQAVTNPLFWLVVAIGAALLVRRRRIAAVLDRAPLVRAGFTGAVSAVAIGVLANDSGATYLAIGTLGLGACLALVWGARAARGSPPEDPQFAD